KNGLGGLGGDLTAVGILFGDVISMLVLMLVGTGIGVYAMLRAERLTGQFVDGVAFGEGLFAWPMRAGSRLAGGGGRAAAPGARRRRGGGLRPQSVRRPRGKGCSPGTPAAARPNRPP